MRSRRLEHRIEIARWDPARAQIASDILQRGGAPIAGASLLYGFRSAEYRDRVLREIRGSYGTDCAAARDVACEQVSDAV